MSKQNSFIAYVMFSLVALFLLYIMGLQVSPSVMAIDLMDEIQLNSKQLGMLSGFFYYSYTLMQIPSGLFYDRFNAKYILGTACAVCATGALLFGMTDQFMTLSLARVLLGFGSSFAFVGALVIAARWFYSSWFAILAGATQFLAGAGALVGALPLAKVVEAYGWRNSMLGLGFFGLLLSFILWVFIKDHPENLDTIEHSQGLTVKSSLKTLASEPQNFYGAIYSFCTWGPVLVFAGLWGIPFFMEKYQVPTAQAAFMVSWIWIGVAIASPLLSWISDTLQRRKIVLYLSALIGLATAMIIIYGPNLSLSMLSILLFLFGLACAAQILAFALIKENNRQSVIATGMGLNNMAVVIGGAVFQPLVGYLMTSLEPLADGVYQLDSYLYALGIVPLCFFIAFLVSFFLIKETYTKVKFDPYQDHVI